MKSFISTVLLLLIVGTGQAQERGYVVIHTSKRYISARLVSEQASKILDYRINLRNLCENQQKGLSLPRKLCVKPNGNVDFPHYPTRDEKSDGLYISVEYSDAYQGWAKGYYLVVIASGKLGDQKLSKALRNAKKYYADAYIKKL